MVSFMIKALILLTTIGYLPGHSLNNFDVKMFHIGAIVLGMCALIEPMKREPPQILVLPLGALMMLNVLFHNLNGNVVYWCLNASIFIFVICVVVMYADPPGEYFKWFALAGVINISVTLMQRAGFNVILDTTSETHPGGLMGNAPRLSTYLAIILPIMWNVSIPMFLACVGVSLAGDPQCAIIGVAAMVVFFQVRNIYFRGLLVASAVAGAVFFREHIMESFQIRFKTWSDCLKLFFKSPVKGFGLGIIPGRERVVGHDYAIHSSLLQFVFGAGVFGIMYIVGLINGLKARIGRDPLSLSVLAIAFLSTIEYPFEISRLWMTIAVIIGLFIVETTKENPNNEIWPRHNHFCFCSV